MTSAQRARMALLAVIILLGANVAFAFNPINTSATLSDDSPNYALTAPSFPIGVVLETNNFQPAGGICYHQNNDVSIAGYHQNGLDIGNSTSSGNSAFIARLDGGGDVVFISKPTANGEGVEFNHVTCLPGGDTVVVGALSSSATFGNTSLNNIGGEDMFVGRLDANGTWVWAASVGSTYDEVILVAEYDPTTDSIRLGGYCDNGTFTIANDSLTCSGKTPVFATMLANGTWVGAYAASTDYGIANKITGLAVDTVGNVLIVGEISDGMSIGSHNLTTSFGGSFFALWNQTFGWLWANVIEGVWLLDAVVNSNYFDVTGYYDGNVTAGSFSIPTYGDTDIFAGRISFLGSWTAANGTGGYGPDVGYSLAVMPSGGVIIAGFMDGGTWNSPKRGILTEWTPNNLSWNWDEQASATGWNSMSEIVAVATQGRIITALGVFNSASISFSGVTYTRSGGSPNGFVTINAPDIDEDGIPDYIDSCEEGMMGWVSNATNDHDSDGCRDWDEDLDDDNDGMSDTIDDCPRGDLDWISNATTDHDDDGCQDSDEDNDDDNDGILDYKDHCEYGLLNWTSEASIDHDGDGCKDDVEDYDDDDDGILDDVDDCQIGALDWISDSDTDHDGDGCKDFHAEDWDDDEDGVWDANDFCARGEMNWTSTVANDRDGDGCRDSSEDLDDDDDGVEDDDDLCQTGMIHWVSNNLTDHESDGCNDENEDEDDDNDTVLDLDDDCNRGEYGWIATAETDYDADGCRDAGEDLDDDNDGVPDTNDTCRTSVLGWREDGKIDRDGDGCEDLYEDPDDDNDGEYDVVDFCPNGELNWNQTDRDDDGCRDETEDNDDDNDGVIDSEDNCPAGDLDWYSLPQVDMDGDGCRDTSEDMDDDGEGVNDDTDNCPNGKTGWISNPSTDIDRDGCRDRDEDDDDDGDGWDDGEDDCPEIWGNSSADRKGCLDSDGDGRSNPDQDHPAHPVGWADAFPDLPLAWMDTDGDGHSDPWDAFPEDPSEWSDSDGDGFGDNRDALPDNPREWDDADEDGVGDNTDRCLDTPPGKEILMNGCHVGYKGEQGASDSLGLILFILAVFFIGGAVVAIMLVRKRLQSMPAKEKELPPPELSEDEKQRASEYYEQCQTQGHEPEAALTYTQQHFPGWEL
jgi:hypothetical protein